MKLCKTGRQHFRYAIQVDSGRDCVLTSPAAVHAALACVMNNGNNPMWCYPGVLSHQKIRDGDRDTALLKRHDRNY